MGEGGGAGRSTVGRHRRPGLRPMTSILPAGTNQTRLWGLTPRQRLARIAARQGIAMAEGAGGGPLVANLDFVFDPAWLSFVAERPEHVVPRDGVPVLAHSESLDARLQVMLAMKEERPLAAAPGLAIVAWEASG